MKKYDLFWNTHTHEPETVKSGFSYWAFLFTFLYPSYKRQWHTALVYFLGWLTISLLSFLVAQDAIFGSLLSTVFSLFVGIDYADCALAEHVKDKKYIHLGTDFAENDEHALFLAFQRHLNSLSKTHV